jgi:hypothetical protein
MPDSYLRLRFDDDGDGTGKLLARAEADGFAGEGGAYFNVSKIEDFANAIGIFPLPSQDKRLSISSGFGSNEHGQLEQEHLGIAVYPADARRGYIGIQVRMATEVWKETRPESKKMAVVEVVTTYEPLSKFSKDLIALLHGKIKEAVLQGQSIV